MEWVSRMTVILLLSVVFSYTLVVAHSNEEEFESPSKIEDLHERYDEEQEQLREQLELAAERYDQQKNLVDSLERERASDKAEIERLKKYQIERDNRRAQAVKELEALKSTAEGTEKEDPENE